jgi:hypothetical protein
MAIELNAAQLKSFLERELIHRLVEWQGGHVNRVVAEHLSDMVVEAIFEAALIGNTEGIEKGIIAGLKMIKAWQD